MIEVKGAEKPVWSDLWLVRLVRLPYTLYVWWKERPERLRKEREERQKWEEQWASMTNAEKKAAAIKAWRRQNR